MTSLAENLKPPFYAAILNEGTCQKSRDHDMTPADEMISIAPSQPGFLGLETMADGDGGWVAVSYWRDLQAEKAWEVRGDSAIQKHFDGVPLKDVCSIRVSRIDHKIGRDKTLRADKRTIAAETSLTSVAAMIMAAFPIAAGLFRHEAVQ